MRKTGTVGDALRRSSMQRERVQYLLCVLALPLRNGRGLLRRYGMYAS